MSKSFPGVLCASLLMLAAAGCGSNRPSLFGGDIKVAAAIDAGANQNNPVAVELVVVYDKDLLQELLKLNARQWFQKRDQYKRDHPDNKDFVSWYWEWVPGQEVMPQDISFGTGARGGLVFADYLNAQDNRARFDPHQDIRIHLEDDNFVVEPLR